jgi:hypothetical protein
MRLNVRSVTLAALAGAVLAMPAGADTFDHSAWDTLLHKNVVKGMVDYDAMAKDPAFAAYLAALAKADLTKLDEKEKLALYINAYNAYTIQLINSHKERESIRNINKSAFIKGHGPWREKLATVGGTVYHLDNIEHDVIRKDFKEPRIHFALVCAAMGCPPLRSEAYTAAKLDAQLTEQAKEFLLQSPKKNRVDVAKGVYYGSPVFSKYYREDFGTTDAAISKYMSQFYPEGAEKAFLAGGKAKIEETDYDWTLNSQEKAKALAAKPAA